MAHPTKEDLERGLNEAHDSIQEQHRQLDILERDPNANQDEVSVLRNQLHDGDALVKLGDDELDKLQ